MRRVQKTRLEHVDRIVGDELSEVAGRIGRLASLIGVAGS